MKIVQNYLIEAVTIATHRPEELAAFYQQAFNLAAPEKIDQDHLAIKLVNITLGFDRIKDKAKNGPGGPVIWFRVENVEETFSQLITAGARARTNVTRDQQPGAAMAVLYDPDDNLIGLIGPSVAGGEL